MTMDRYTANHRDLPIGPGVDMVAAWAGATKAIFDHVGYDVREIGGGSHGRR